MAHVLIPAVLAVSYWVIARSCGYDHGAVFRYIAYVVGAIWLPGHCALALLSRERPPLERSLALGLPLGFTLEILLYLACTSAGWRGAYPWLAAALAAGLAAVVIGREGWRVSLPSVRHWGASPGVVMSVVLLLVMLTTAAHMYAPSPLAGGLLQHSTHHDWVYLVSRAAEIKNRWPLEDPSLAGTPLSYHYFLLVHVAAASRVAELEIPLVLLRLASVPLGIALLAQAFVLGKELGRSIWAGVLAAMLLFAAGEVSWGESTTGGLFQSLFVSWLYISPTFLFGMIFMGALMIWAHRLMDAEAVRWMDYGVLFLLAMVATGAKGTSVGPLAAAAGLWCGWRVVAGQSWPGRMILIGALLGAAFVAAYFIFLRGYSGEGTKLSLFAFPQVSPFWLDHVGSWTAALQESGLGPNASATVAGLAGSLVVLAGLNGVMLLGLFQAFRRRSRARDPFMVWVGLVAVACVGFGNVVFLDSHGESYLYLPMKLPLVALTAAAVAEFCRVWATRAGLDSSQQRMALRWLVGGASLAGLALLVVVGLLPVWGGVAVAVPVLALLAPSETNAAEARIGLRRLVPGLVVAVPLLLLLAVQVRFGVLGSRGGLMLWQNTAASGKEQSLAELREGLGWLREHTPTDAVCIAAMFAPDWATLDKARVVDRTTLDKHYYYSALAERRLFIEGPAYVRDQGEASARMQAVGALLQGDAFQLPPELQGRSLYLLVDRLVVPDGMMPPPSAEPVYENRRVRLYRLPGSRMGLSSKRLGERPLGGAKKDDSGQEDRHPGDPGVGEAGRVHGLLPEQRVASQLDGVDHGIPFQHRPARSELLGDHRTRKEDRAGP